MARREIGAGESGIVGAGPASQEYLECEYNQPEARPRAQCVEIGAVDRREGAEASMGEPGQQGQSSHATNEMSANDDRFQQHCDCPHAERRLKNYYQQQHGR